MNEVVVLTVDSGKVPVPANSKVSWRSRASDLLEVQFTKIRPTPIDVLSKLELVYVKCLYLATPFLILSIHRYLSTLSSCAPPYPYTRSG